MSRQSQPFLRLTLGSLVLSIVSAPLRPASGNDLVEELRNLPYKIVFESCQDGNWDLFQVRADGSDRVNLTATPDVNELYPHVSHDGTKICFSVDMGEGDNKTRSVYCMNVDASGRRLVAPNARDACWAADDTSIVYLKDEFTKLALIDYATKGVFLVHPTRA